MSTGGRSHDRRRPTLDRGRRRRARATIRLPCSAVTRRRVDGRPAVVIRTMQPAASAVELVTPDGVIADAAAAAGRAVRGDACRWTGTRARASPTASACTRAARSREIVDPYQFGQVLTDFDLHLSAKARTTARGRSSARIALTIDGVTGVHFAVWAPNAQRVSVIGDFNRWDGRAHPMRQLVPSGVWEIFVPDLPRRRLLQVRGAHAGRAPAHKADPYARRFEVPPQHGVDHLDRRRLRVGRRRLDARSAVVRRLARAADVGLRSAPRVVAARARTRATAT